MRQLTVYVENQISEATARIRAELFPGPDGTGPLYDEFDERSLHVSICEDRQLAAYARITAGPPGVFSSWSDGAADLPEGGNVVDLGRFMVTSRYWGLELFRAVGIEALVHSQREGLTHANGAYVVPERKRTASAIHDLGFEKSGPPVHEVEPHGFRADIQPVTGILNEMSARWDAQRRICDARLSSAGLVMHWSPQLDVYAQALPQGAPCRTSGY